ncbi:hypothetical protein ACQ4PT_028501 [Festuca glaucescens]
MGGGGPGLPFSEQTVTVNCFFSIFWWGTAEDQIVPGHCVAWPKTMVQTVAIKHMDKHGFQGNIEFLTEVSKLSKLHQENLIDILGYCADGDQRLLVYEHMDGGTLEDYLFDLRPEKKPLDWTTRMKVAFGAAQGLEYLHEKANPPVVYGDLKASKGSNVLDASFMPKPRSSARRAAATCPWRPR